MENLIIEEFDVIPCVTTEQSSKRKTKKEQWKKTAVAKQKREARNQGCIISCNHQVSDKWCKARSINADVLYYFHKKFWKLESAVKQRLFIQSYISISPIQRRYRENETRIRVKKYNILCNVPLIADDSNQSLVPVCRDAFLSILSIGRFKLEHAARMLFNEDLMKERRGGSTSKMVAVKEKIIEHIKLFRCREKHYGKVTEFNRQYLPAELNIRKMHAMYLERYATDNPELKCKYSYYYTVFRNNFNIGFGTLKIDTCSTCEKFKNAMKNEEMEEIQKKSIIVEHMVHKTRARRFFQELNRRPERTISINFDLMQNQPLPKTQIGEAYYSRQLWYYTFGIIIHNEKKSLNPNSVHFFR